MALFRHVAKGTSPGESWTFTMHSEGAGTLAAAQASWLAASGLLWTGGIDGLICPDVQMTEVSTASIDEATDRQMSRLADAVTRPGVSIDPCLPFQCAVAISLRTDLATRSGRGRFYLPPFATTTQDGGQLTGAAITTAVTAVEAMFSELDTGGLTPVVRNRLLHVSTTVTRADIGDVIDTQRRRRNKLVEARTPITVA